MIRNHDNAPTVLLEHLSKYVQDSATWDLRFAQNATSVVGTDFYWDMSNTVLRHRFTYAGARYFVGQNRRLSLVCWGIQLVPTEHVA